LSSVLVVLMLLAFLMHTVLQLSDSAYQQLRLRLATRKTFFDDLRALTRYLCFATWDDLLTFMLTHLEPAPD
ncbi:MAG: ISNCY family transposase, partial [Chloroflexi bacterium]|nr:ISNCY family transposase [Chloroflexota bacterium]